MCRQQHVTSDVVIRCTYCLSANVLECISLIRWRSGERKPDSARGKATMRRLLQDLLTYRRRGCQHELDFTTTVWWETPGSLRCASAQTDWAMELSPPISRVKNSIHTCICFKLCHIIGCLGWWVTCTLQTGAAFSHNTKTVALRVKPE